MGYKVDFLDGAVLEWALTADGAAATRVTNYTPTVFVGMRDGDLDTLDWLASTLGADPKVAALGWEEWYTTLGAAERDPVLRVDLERVDEVRTFAREVRTLHEPGVAAPGTFQLYNVDLSPEFRYCLETGTDPTPTRPLSTVALAIGEKPLADRDVTALAVDGERLGDAPADVLRALAARLEADDPDVLRVNTARVVPLLSEAAAEHGLDGWGLGRRPGYQRLAGANTIESYGVIGHSPARYNVPGRAIIDESNSFLWGKAGLHGLIDLTERSWKPLQEAGWASIGNLLTAIQIREVVRNRGVLVPQDKADPEHYKDARTLHAADRGGFTFDPEVGLFEDVHELDFSSLYPNIMIEHNVSPETVLCDCHAGREDVPGIGYHVCDERGMIPDVLEPIVGDRDAIKAALRGPDDLDPDRRAELEARSDALKWILVTCFGYQGYKNSKFGRIEAHEAINAHARDILLRAKERLEAAGWRIVHGIVDSIWVTARPDAGQTPLREVAAEVSDAVGIRLEYEAAYDWMCFVPRRERTSGALTKYFGRRRGSDAFKTRGIEVRQRSTPPFVAAVQRDLMRALDRHRAPAPVCDRLRRHLSRLRGGDVPADELVIRKRSSRPVAEYQQGTHTKAALLRYRRHGIEKHPGEDVRYVVVVDGARLPERVRLPFEAIDRYDPAPYAALLVRAAESIVSPLGWDRHRIRGYLRGTDEVGLGAFG